MQVFILAVRDLPDTDDAGVTYFRRIVETRVWHDESSQVESALKDVLAAAPGVAAIVSDRISVSVRVQSDPFPLIVLHRITGGPDYHMRGTSGLTESLIQIDCWARESWAQADAIRAAVVAVLTPLALPN